MFDSLTVLDYIKTSIEILMLMKLEEGKTNVDAKKFSENFSKIQKMTNNTLTKDENETP